MRRPTRTGTVTALAAAVGLAATACGGGASDAAQDAARLAAEQPRSVSATITYWDTSDATNEAPAYQELVKRFEDKYPKIDVNYVNVPFDGADDKFKNAAGAQSGAPDVMRADVGWTPTFAALGYLQPLDGTVALAGDEDYLAGPYGTNKYQGKTYGVPQVTDTLGLLYNKQHFEKAGIAEPPQTWDEAREAAKKLEEAIPETTGIFINADSYFLTPFVYGQGGRYVDVKAQRITIDSPAVAKAVKTAQSLTKPGVGATDTSSNGYTNMMTGFKTGSISMIINGPWAIKDILAGSAFDNADDLGIAPVPAGPKGRGGPVGGHNLVVYAGSPHLAASYLFVEFLNSAQSQKFIAEHNNTMPTRKSVYEMDSVASDRVISAFARPMELAVPRPSAAGAGDIYDLFTPFYRKILGGQATVQQGLAQAQREAQGIVPGFES